MGVFIAFFCCCSFFLISRLLLQICGERNMDDAEEKEHCKTEVLEVTRGDAISFTLLSECRPKEQF